VQLKATATEHSSASARVMSCGGSLVGFSSAWEGILQRLCEGRQSKPVRWARKSCVSLACRPNIVMIKSRLLKPLRLDIKALTSASNQEEWPNQMSDQSRDLLHRLSSHDYYTNPDFVHVQYRALLVGVFFWLLDPAYSEDYGLFSVGITKRQRILTAALANPYLHNAVRAAGRFNWVTDNAILDVLNVLIGLHKDWPPGDPSLFIPMLAQVLDFMLQNAADINLLDQELLKFPLDIIGSVNTRYVDMVAAVAELLIHHGARRYSVNYWKARVEDTENSPEFRQMLASISEQLSIEGEAEKYRVGGSEYLAGKQRFEGLKGLETSIKLRQEAQQLCSALQNVELSRLREISRAEGVPFSRKSKGALCWDLATHFVSRTQIPNP
jgi:hypothetical protein